MDIFALVLAIIFGIAIAIALAVFIVALAVDKSNNAGDSKSGFSDFSKTKLEMLESEERFKKPYI